MGRALSPSPDPYVICRGSSSSSVIPGPCRAAICNHSSSTLLYYTIKYTSIHIYKQINRGWEGHLSLQLFDTKNVTPKHVSRTSHKKQLYFQLQYTHLQYIFYFQNNLKLRILHLKMIPLHNVLLLVILVFCFKAAVHTY